MNIATSSTIASTNQHNLDDCLYLWHACNSVNTIEMVNIVKYQQWY